MSEACSIAIRRPLAYAFPVGWLMLSIGPAAVFLSPRLDSHPTMPSNASRGKHQLRSYTMAIDKELLNVLACPKCKGDIHLNQTGDALLCDACRLSYPIEDDIPVMAISLARLFLSAFTIISGIIYVMIVASVGVLIEGFILDDIVRMALEALPVPAFLADDRLALS
jgi:uncharacterized protein